MAQDALASYKDSLMKSTPEMGYGDLAARMTDDSDRQKTGRTTQQSIDMQSAQGIQARVRQGIGLPLTDDAHLTTHEPDPSAGTDGLK